MQFSETNSVVEGCGTIVRTWSVTDSCGNTATTSQTITVVDTVAPAFREPLPSDGTVECDAVPAAAVLTAHDACDADVPVSYSESRADGACGDSYVLTRAWRASDDCGNELTHVQTLTVVDRTPPSMSAPRDIEACSDPGLCSAVVVAETPAATDGCDAAPVVSGVRSDGQPLSDPYPCGVTTITWTATDRCGNSVSSEQSITVRDCEPPRISRAPERPRDWYAVVAAAVNWMTGVFGAPSWAAAESSSPGRVISSIGPWIEYGLGLRPSTRGGVR